MNEMIQFVVIGLIGFIALGFIGWILHIDEEHKKAMKKMKGLAALGWMIFAVLAIAATLAANHFYPADTQAENVLGQNVTNVSSIGNTTDIVKVTVDAARHAPLQDFWDYLAAGAFGIAVWLANWVLYPAINLIMNAVSKLIGDGRTYVLDPVYAYLMMFIIVLGGIYIFKDKLWEMITKYVLWTAGILLAVFVMGIVLTYIGAV